MRVKIDTGAVLYAVNLGKHLEQAERGIRFMATAQITNQMALLSLANIKRSLRAAVREIEMIEAGIRNAANREDEA